MILAMMLPATLTAGAQVVGQNAQPGTSNAPFTISATSKLVIEAVNVKDKQGKSISGLTAKDFTVTEDGVKQEVRYCEYQELPVAPPAAPAKPAPEEVKIYNRLGVTQIAPETPGDVRYKDRRLITMYFDLTSMPPGDKLRALVAAQNFIRTQMTSADVVALGWTSPMYREVMEHPAFDEFWRAISTREQLDKVRVPVFSVGGWYDNFVQSDLEAFAALRKRSGVNRVLVGPWAHNMSAPFETANFGADASVPVRALQLEWFDQWLMGRDSPLLSKPPVKIFMMGSNLWREEREWPPPGARQKTLYLESAGKANSLAGDGALNEKPARNPAADQFVFDPYAPVPTRGGAVCCNPKVFPWGPMDQRPVEQRKDVLVYTTKPMTHDLEAIGSVQAVLYVASSARDTDFTAKLVDVFPNGEARNLTDGILRLRYRNSLEKPELATPGEIYRVTVDAGVTGNVFRKGHRIRLEISSSNFPRFDRNANTGGAVEQAAKLVKASQTVYHDTAHPSCLLLMVMP